MAGREGPPPGWVWERDLEAALDAAACFLLVASPESLKSPHVRSEWQRAKTQHKRIVIVLRRRARLPAELADCEVIGFRGAFTPARRRLTVCLGANAGVGTTLFFWKLPPRILAIAITLDWLWRREWIDFRHWHVNRLDCKKDLFAVPEAVTGTRFPTPVRIAHHLVCSMAGLAMLLPALANPSDTGEAPAVVVMALLIWYGTLGRRLLRRTISGRALYRAWPVGILAVAGLAVWSVHMAMARGVGLFRATPIALFLAAWSVVWVRNRGKLAFWFPAAGVPSLKGAASLSTRRNWQTLL